MIIDFLKENLQHMINIFTLEASPPIPFLRGRKSRIGGKGKKMPVESKSQNILDPSCKANP